ncbi:hypothetical protein [Ligilactobacillus faecis]|uniref:hypothetical protein n=1 Tax=Ligilactobacillus faecis TaxID=762833 RepID=UPI002468D435|nr:hypothetical protein [Ligilactobacillus faecis]WGN88630.1 hypothetical protein QFX10_05965 [Ligilactobacillus faecis]
MPVPKLTGVVQVDETFICERQKESRELTSTLDKEIERKPRYARNPSKFGVVNSKFATVVTTIDNHSYRTCKVSNLEKLFPELFFDLFDNYFANISFLCSDTDNIYEDYYQLRNIPTV